MCISSETVTEREYIIRHFEECFGSYKDRRIALYPGEYLEEIIRNFDHEYHFRCVLEPGAVQVPSDVDLVILTDRRTGKEPDYNRIRRSCEEQNVLLLDLFGLDQIELHRELKAQQYLSIPQWEELLAGYDVVTILLFGAVVKRFELQDRWVIRRRFLTLYEWLVSHGKTVLFLWDEEEQVEPLKSEPIDISGKLIKREGNDQGFLRLAVRYKGKKAIHIGVGTVRDGIIPREYGMDSRLFRYFESEVFAAGREDWFSADRELLKEAIDSHDIISFDIFDTLLKRTVLHPENVFEIVEEWTGIKGFADCRHEIQNAVPQSSMDEIYDWLKEQRGYDERTAELLRHTELKTESEVITARRSMTELFNYAKSRNKTVVLVSDMYLDADFIRELLERNGIAGYHALILSYQYKMLKHEGLFEKVLELRKNDETILHIGDDPYSDYVSAREYGLDAFWVPSCLHMAMENGYETAVRMCRSSADAKILGLGIAAGFDDPFAQNTDILIANMVVAPLAMSYLQWVCSRMAGKEYRFFLLTSRDGNILLNAYNRLQKKYPDRLPEGKYYYMNRHAAFLTVMDDYDLVNVFGNISDSDEDPRGILRRQFCLPAGQLLPHRGGLFGEYYHKHEHLIHAAADQFRKNYRKYLEQEGIQGKKCAVMDFVSEGSSQMMLEKNVTDVMDGYYIGVPEYMTRYARNIHYYLDQAMMDYDTEMKIEVYFTSLEPALDHIDEQGRPIFAEEVRDQSVLDRTASVHNEVERYLNTYLDHLYDPEDVTDKEMIFELCRTINNYNVENYYYDDLSGKRIRAHL